MNQSGYVYLHFRETSIICLYYIIYIYTNPESSEVEHLLILILQYDRSRLIITHIAFYINASIYKLEYTFTLTCNIISPVLLKHLLSQERYLEMFYDNCVDYESSVNAQRHKNRRKTSIHLGTYNNTTCSKISIYIRS